jgi:hypothetical protein
MASSGAEKGPACQGRREKGEGRREKGEGRKQNWVEF